MANLTLAQLKQLLHYDPETGIWTRIVDRPGVKAGANAAHVLPNGYHQIVVLRKRYLAHRLAWFYTHGGWPKLELDHINRDRGDNRIANLREVTRSQNQIWAAYRAGKSGVRGTKKVGRRWRSQIRVDGNLLHLGYHDTQNDARAAYERAAMQHFGMFAPVGAN